MIETTPHAPRSARAVAARRAGDVGLGVVVTTARVAVTCTRLALLPLRVAGKTPLGELTARELAAVGRSARNDGRARLTAAARSALAAPEVEGLVEEALTGPLPDAVMRGALQDGVQRRIAAGLDDEAVVLVVERAMDTRAFGIALERALGSPAVRAALTHQSASFAGEIGGAVRRRLDAVDSRVGRHLPAAAPGVYPGVVARSLAFVLDLVLAQLAFLAVAALAVLVGSLIGDFGPSWGWRGALGGGWLLALGAYFVFFWSLDGQTPGMRLIGARVTRSSGGAPGVGRAVVRYLGLLAATAPLLLGLVPILFDRRRRGLQDFLAGTTVRVDPSASLSES